MARTSVVTRLQQERRTSDREKSIGFCSILIKRIRLILSYCFFFLLLLFKIKCTYLYTRLLQRVSLTFSRLILREYRVEEKTRW